MAVKLSTKTNVDPITATWPYGEVRNKVGVTGGTKYDKNQNSDNIQFFEKLMDEAGVVHNGLLDNGVNTFQLYTALRTLFPLRQRLINIGNWDMNTNANVTVDISSLGITMTKIRRITAIIVDDGGLVRVGLDGAGSVAGVDAADDVLLNRETGGTFDAATYGSAVTDRGFLVVEYID